VRLDQPYRLATLALSSLRDARAPLVLLASLWAAAPLAAQEARSFEPNLLVTPDGFSASAAPVPEARPAWQATRPDVSSTAVPPHPTAPAFTWSSAAIFLGGAATALAAHETCHLAANLATGNQPTFAPVMFMDAIPYFAIVPSIRCKAGECKKRDGASYYAGRPGLYTIVSAGLQCQHYEDEVILSLRPGLRLDNAPFRKGMLAFNTLTSIGYVLANWTDVEPVDGDVRGIHRDGGAPRMLLSSMVLGIALIDITRYYYPEARWLAWLSRVAKVSVTGVAFAM
jgi:hypothetical protein